MAFGQGTGATLSGTVSDPSGGVLAGANIVARNVDTGVETRTTSSDRGAYTFPSLQPGTYELTANAPGFSRAVRSDVRLNVGAQSTLNLTLAVAGTVTEVDVTGVIESVILEAGASTGTVMQEETLSTVPLLQNNVMSIVNLMGGVTPTSDISFSPGAQTFAGVSAANINVVRDGLTVNEVRLATGINASTNINTEMIGEFRMVLSPVDAEMGRGAGQVQMTTRSGSNAFRGSGVWNVQNTALDALDFSQKYSNVQPNWRNMHNYMLTASGPIVRNKSFFFVTWEQQISRVKAAYTAKSLTTCARVGIYRYIGGAVPGSASENNLFIPGSDTRPSVDQNGNILDRQSGATFMAAGSAGSPISFDQAHPSANYGGIRPGDGDLMFESVFGPLTPAARAEILKDIRDVYNPCASFANSSMWNPSAGQFGTNGLWDERPWGAGVNGRDGRAYRNAYDPTGFVGRYTDGVQLSSGGMMVMPPVNYWFGNGDGLNVASHRWTRSSIGGREGTILGTGGDPDRKAITFKLDHNINNDHRLSGTYTHENFMLAESEPTWPAEYGGFGGAITRRPRNVQVSLTSTITPTILNEFRMGYMKSNTWTSTAINQEPERARELMNLMMPTELTHNNIALIGVGEGWMDFHTDEQTYNWASHPIGSRGAIQASQGSIDNRWSFANTVTWMKGAHSFKGGVDYRRQGSIQQVEGSLSFGRWANGNSGVSGFPGVFGSGPANLGATTGSGTVDRRQGTLLQHPLTQAGENWRNYPASGNSSDRHPSQTGGVGNIGVSGLFQRPYELMTFFSGSVYGVNQYFYLVPDPSKPYGARWNDATNPDERIFETDVRTQEFAFFFKDDWRVSSNLTLNLGVRWEYYGVPHAAGNKTLSLVGGSTSVFGTSQPVDAVRFMHDRSLLSQYADIPFGQLGDNGAVMIAPATRYEYIGSGTANDRMPWNRDMNNFAPHLGFSYQLPWFGRGMTTLRGGWSISYAPLGQLGLYDGWIANVGAGANVATTQLFRGEGDWNISGSTAHYMDLTDLSRTDPDGPLPMRVRSGLEPLTPMHMGYFQSGATGIDENIHSPLTHSLNVSVTRNIGRNLTVDVRYIGTFGREQITGININNNNYINSGLAAELNKIRGDSSYQSDLFNSLIPRGGYGTNAALSALSGSDQIRNQNGGGSNLTQMSFNAIADVLVGNGGFGAATGESGRLYRRGCLPNQRQNPSGDLTDHVGNPCLYHTPLNFLRNNTQHATATMQTNLVKSNYHSMQAQVTMRPTHGLNFQATWTWSRALSDSGWTNYLGDRNYTLTGQHRSHALNVFGSYELPFGARGYLLRESPTFVKKIVEGWQVSWVSAIRSGSPLSITGQSTQWGTNWPILVRSDLWDDKSGKPEGRWNDDGTYAGGRYWGDKYTRVMDPGICSPVRNGGNLADALYDRWCINSATGNMPSGTGTAGNTRAIALADPNRPATDIDPFTGAPYAMLYDRDTMGDDGVMYKAGTPVIVFRNATGSFAGETYNPLSNGNFRNNRITRQGDFTLDAGLSKSVEFMEGKRLEIRVDAANILNRPTHTGEVGTSVRYYNGGRVTQPASPAQLSLTGDLNAPATAFGNMPAKTGHRTFQGRLRISF